MQRPKPETVTLNDILITEELFNRSPRPPNLQAENQAMRSIARQMAQDSQSLMQTLADTTLELCQAGSAGVSLLETTPDGEEIFRWNVLAGALAPYVGETIPRNFSPCGVCLDQGTPVLFSHPERYFTDFQAANTPVVEGLVLPLVADDHVLGTIWIMSHDEQRHFDSEDVRIMTSLADFTATALLLKQRQTGELLAANVTLETEVVERKQAEAQSRALISNLPGGAVFVVDRNLRYLLAEGEALAIAGFKPEDLVGKTIFEVLPPELATYYEPMYRKALTGEPFEHEHSAHEHTYISRGTPLRSADGEVYAVLAVSYDITKRKQAEADRQQAEDALRQSEAKYRALFNSIDEAYAVVEVLVDDKGEWNDFLFLEVNPAFVKQTSMEYPVGRKATELLGTPNSSWAKVYGQVAETGEPIRFEESEATLGRVFDLYVFRLGGDGSRRVAALFTDITDRKRREANLAFLADLMSDFAPLATAEEIMEMAGKRITEHLDLSRYLFVEINPEAGECTYLLPSHPPGQLEISGSYRLADYHTEEENRLLSAGHSMVVNDVRDGTRSPEQIAAFEAFDIASIVNTPYLSNGRWVFDLGVTRSKPSVWREDEIELLRELSARVWLRIERARAEADLRQSEAKYRSLFNSMDEGYFLCDVIFDESDQPIDLFYIDENPAAIRMTGQSFRGQRLRAINPNYEEYWYEIFGRVAQTGQAEWLERYAEANQIWYDFYVFKVGSDDTRQVAVVFNDITDRKRTEEQLRRAAEMDAFRVKLSDGLRSLSDPLEIQAEACRLLGEHLGVDRAYYAEVNEAENYTRINQNYLRGDSPSLVCTLPLTDYGWVLPYLKRGETVVMPDVESSDVVPVADCAAMAAIKVAAHISLPLIKEGTLVGALNVTESTPRQWSEMDIKLVRETAERIWAAIERARSERALRESELQRLREQAAREQERQRAESLAELDRAKTIFFSNVSHEFRTPLTLILSPLQDALKRLEKWEGQWQDSSILKQQLQLAHRNSLRLLKLVNTLLDFSRIEAKRMKAVYEPTDLAILTTELASVFRSAIEQAGLRLIVDCPPLPEPVYVDREMWEKIVFNLISNAFKFTLEGEITVSLRAESRGELQTSTSNLQHLTSDSQAPSSDLETSTSDLETSTSDLETSRLNLETSTSESEASTSELKTSTSELEPSSSELKISPSELEPSSSELEVSPSQLKTIPHVILEIRDTGSGIAPEHLPHLFERFYQIRATQARTHEGSGIGLALVHELVRLHGGTIEVNSTVGEGTCFEIALPFGTDHLPSEHLRRGEAVRFQDEGAPRSGSVSDRQPTHTLASTAMGATSYVEEAERWLPTGDPPQPPLERGENAIKVPLIKGDLGGSSEPEADSISSARVLIVDDNADMREYLTHILSDYVQVEAVADGAAALATIQTQIPNLVLSDVMMPGLDGFELLQALRSNPRTREIPIILLSARAGEEAIVEGLKAGADDYLVKPFSAQELVSRVNAYLQIAQLRGETLQHERSMNRWKDEFISVVSHELNTPLVSILGWTRLLRSDSSSPAILTKALDIIERNATLQGKLVQDLLDISRITAGRLRLNLQLIELKSIIEIAIATITQIAADKEIHVTWQDKGTSSVVVMGDSDRLQQVICNLLTNAVKFTPPSGSVTVELSVMKDAHSADTAYAEIRVIDTGIGISADFLPHVFDRFRQAEGAHTAKGLGLGLAIARHIVELHNGTIHAESAGEGQGATFIVRLPLLQNKDDLM